MASLPAALRNQASFIFDSGTLPALTKAMAAWMDESTLNAAVLRKRFFGPGADDAVAEKLRSAAFDVQTAINQADMRRAAGKVAETI